MVRAGIPLEFGVEGSREQSAGALRDFSETLARQLQRGATLEEALSPRQTVLPPAYRAVVAAGLRTGRLDEVLGLFNDLAMSTAELRRQVRLSLVYPAVIFGLAYALFVTFVIYLVPQLQRTYEVFGIEESFGVWLLLWLYRTAAIWGLAVPAVIAGVLLLTWLISRWLPWGRGRLSPQRWIPGGRDLSVARFARMLSLLSQHEVPLPEGCRLAGQAAGDDWLRDQAEQLASSVESGQALSEAVTSAHQIPGFLRWLMAVGDRQGTLASSLRQGAELHEQRAMAKLAWFRRVVPPLVVIGCCGSITLLYGLTLFLPLTELIRSMGHP